LEEGKKEGWGSKSEFEVSFAESQANVGGDQDLKRNWARLVTN
jgi:hypothetical protein